MDFLLLYIAVMTVPGVLLSQLLNLDACRSAVAIALSYALLTLLYVLASTTGLQIDGFGYLVLASYLVILTAKILRRQHRGSWLSLPFRVDRIHLIPAVAMGSVLLYMAWAGPYVEVPADAWRHIDELSQQISQTAEGKIASMQGVKQFFSGTTNAWYGIHAYFLDMTQTSLEAGLGYLAMANTLLFCIGVYSFALFIFNRIEISRTTRHLIASASVFFFMTHFGISVFSYVRYYVYGATIINYVVYLGAVACFLRFLGNIEGNFRYLVAFGFLGLVTATAHKQEALFILVMACSVLVVECVRAYSAVAGDAVLARDPGVSRRKKYLLMMTGVVVAGYMLTHVWMHMTMGQENPLHHGRMADIQNYVPFLRNLYVLKPTYQFYEVITVWGVFVYFLFFIHVKRFLTESYFVAGMAMPVITVFNPIFTDFFLHISPPTVLYRMCYMLPLPFLGAFFLVKGVKAEIGAPGWRSKSYGIILVALLIGLLLPVNTTYFVSPYSKVYMLAPVSEKNDYRIWSDLLEFLRSKDPTLVITDSVTGYVIDGMTNHNYPGVKFYVKNWRKWLRVSGKKRGSYDFEDFRDKNGALVIVNKRDGAMSETGHYGGHWPEDIMKVSKQYSDAFLQYVNNHPSMFEEIWRRDRIVVYQVNTNGYKAG